MLNLEASLPTADAPCYCITIVREALRTCRGDRKPLAMCNRCNVQQIHCGAGASTRKLSPCDESGAVQTLISVDGDTRLHTVFPSWLAALHSLPPSRVVPASMRGPHHISLRFVTRETRETRAPADLRDLLSLVHASYKVKTKETSRSETFFSSLFPPSHILATSPSPS